MLKTKDYKIVKRGDRYYVIKSTDIPSMAKTVYLYSHQNIEACQNWVSRKKSWFKKLDKSRLNYPLDTVGNID